jgi:hypothetical protein
VSVASRPRLSSRDMSPARTEPPLLSTVKIYAKAVVTCA